MTGLLFPLQRSLCNAFAKSLETFQPAPATRGLDLAIENDFERDRSRSLPNLVAPHEYDPVCAALHRLINRSSVDKVNYAGRVDGSLFWPYPEGGGPQGPLWSSVRRLMVMFDQDSPCGLWYFRDPDADMEDEEYLPIVPNDQAILPLLEAFARAIALMPALEEACLTSWVDDGEFFVVYASPRNSTTGWEKYIEGDAAPAPRVFFHCEDWRPSDKVLDLFQKIGRGTHQQDVIFTFLPNLRNTFKRI